MKEAMQSLIKKFKAIGVTGSAMVTELLRFRVLDQILQTSPEVRQWGITGDKLYELAQQSTVEVFGELPYDQVAFESVYGPSFAVEVMDFITETGYVEGLAAGEQWRLPFKDIIEFHKNSEGIILFANIEEYAALAEEILQAIPSERLLLYTSSETCYNLFKQLYPLAPVIDEWPEDVIFDHIVAASTGLFRAPVEIMQELANRVGNITELGTAHYFIPISAIQDQVGMNRMAVQYMLLQPRLEAIREWAPLGTYEFVYTNRSVKKVALEIREVMGDTWRSTPFIALPHEVLASMDTFSMVQYALSLCGIESAMKAQLPTLGEDGFTSKDPKVPLYVQKVFNAFEATRLELERQGTEVQLKLVDHEGRKAGETLDEDSYAELMEQSKVAEEDTAYWMFTNPEAAYIWYTYFRSLQGEQVLTKLAQMVLTPEALLQLMGSVRRQIIKEEPLAELATRFEKARAARKAALAKADADWQAEIEAIAKEIVPNPTESN